MENLNERASRVLEKDSWYAKMMNQTTPQLKTTAEDALKNYVMSLAPSAEERMVDQMINDLMTQLISGFNTGE